MPEFKGTIKDINQNSILPTTTLDNIIDFPQPTILDKNKILKTDNQLNLTWVKPIIPTPTSADAGKILLVNNNGEYELTPPTVITEAEYARINSGEYGQ